MVFAGGGQAATSAGTGPHERTGAERPGAVSSRRDRAVVALSRDWPVPGGGAAVLLVIAIDTAGVYGVLRGKVHDACR
jgi:hypothetical protein